MRVASMFALLVIGIIACLLIGSTALAIFIAVGPPLGGEAHGLIFIARLIAFVGFVCSPAEQLYRRYRHIIASQIPAFPHGVRHLLFCASIIFCGVLSLIPVYLVVRAIFGPDPIVFLATALATLSAAHWTYIWWDRNFPFQAINCLRRGRALQTLDEVQKKLTKPVFAGEQKVPWGGADVPESQLAHFCVVGTSGSGKTATIVEMMRTVLPRIKPGSDHRAIVYDAKRDMLSILAALEVPNDRIRMLNPFDKRSYAWDIAADITTPALARQAAANLIRSSEGPNKYFTDAARAILAGTIEALGKIAPQRWTLRDVFYFAERRERMRSLFAHVGAHALIDQFFEPEQTFQSVRSTIAAELSLLEPIAALWAHTPLSRRFSLRDWLRSESILILGTDETVTAAMQAVNRVFVDRLGQLLLSEDDLTEANRLTRRTWLFFDELKEAGNFTVLPRLLTTGRSKGVRIVVGFQDFNGLASVYGPELAREIPGMCVSKAFFRIDEPDTAQWAARTLGESEFQEFTRSMGSDVSVGEHIVQRSIVLASELQNLPYPSPATPFLRGYYITPAVGAYHSQLPFVHPRPTNDPALNFWRRPDNEQHLPDMTDADFDRLGFRPPDAPPASMQAPVAPDEPDMMPRLTRRR